MTESVTGPLGATALGQSRTAGLGALDGDAFLKLMIAQLRYQNPFEPMDTSQMLQQTASLSTVESLQQMAQSQRLILGLQQATVASSLIGKDVQAVDHAGEPVSGRVASVKFTIDGPVLTVGDKEVPVGNVTSMTQS